MTKRLLLIFSLVLILFSIQTLSMDMESNDNIHFNCYYTPPFENETYPFLIFSSATQEKVVLSVRNASTPLNQTYFNSIINLSNNVCVLDNIVDGLCSSKYLQNVTLSVSQILNTCPNLEITDFQNINYVIFWVAIYPHSQNLFLIGDLNIKRGSDYLFYEPYNSSLLVYETAFGNNNSNSHCLSGGDFTNLDNILSYNANETWGCWYDSNYDSDLGYVGIKGNDLISSGEPSRAIHTNIFYQHIRDISHYAYLSNVTDVCIENWQPYYTACNVGDNQTLYYLDSSMCGTYDDLPIDNSTISSCNYCSISYHSVESACVNSQKTTSYVYDNYGTCCALTGIPADCNLPANTTEACSPIGIHQSSDITGLVIDFSVESGMTWLGFAGLMAITGLFGYLMFLL